VFESLLHRTALMPAPTANDRLDPQPPHNQRLCVQNGASLNHATITEVILNLETFYSLA
jgi:hypothetical protein